MKRTCTVLLCLLAGCPAPSTSPRHSASVDAFALQYEPGDSPTDRLIKNAQARVTRSAGVDEYLALATLLMRRRRETSAPILMSYAENAIQAALRIEPNNPQARFLLGMTQQYAHRFEQAVETARQIIADAPRRPDAYHLLGDALLELGKYEEAVAAYQSAMDLRPDLRAYNRAAYVSWLHGQDDEAIRFLDMALDAQSQLDAESAAWCFVDLGEIYRHRGDTRRAIAAADRALSRVPDYVPALTLRARTHRAAESFDEAIRDYRAVLERLPTVDTLVELADVLERQGDLPGARRRRQQAQVLARSDPRPMAHDLARRNIDIDRALKLAEAELADRQGIFAWDTYGLVLIRAGRLDEAEAALTKARALRGPFAEFELHGAVLAVAREDLVTARAALGQALRMNPTVDPRLVRELEAVVGRDAHRSTQSERVDSFDARTSEVSR